jgi:hypothetical protein
MYIEKDGDSYAVSIESDDEPGEVDQAYNVSVNGTEMTFNLMLEDNDPPLELNLNVSFLSDDNFEGTISIAEFGSFPFTGKRTNKPD